MNSQERLTQIETAISQIESGAQEYQIGSRRVKKADLGLLYKERDRLEEKVKADNGFDDCYVANYYTR